MLSSKNNYYSRDSPTGTRTPGSSLNNKEAHTGKKGRGRSPYADCPNIYTLLNLTDEVQDFNLDGLLHGWSTPLMQVGTVWSLLVILGVLQQCPEPLGRDGLYLHGHVYEVIDFGNSRLDATIIRLIEIFSFFFYFLLLLYSHPEPLSLTVKFVLCDLLGTGSEG